MPGILFMEKERNADQLLYHAYGPFGHSFEPQKQVGRFRADPITNALFLKASANAGVKAELRQLLRDANERAAGSILQYRYLNRKDTPCVSHGSRGFSGPNPFCLDERRRVPLMIGKFSIWEDSG